MALSLLATLQPKREGNRFGQSSLVNLEPFPFSNLYGWPEEGQVGCERIRWNGWLAQGKVAYGGRANAAFYDGSPTE